MTGRNAPRARRRAIALTVATAVALSTWSATGTPASAADGFEALAAPRRILETRLIHETFDGRHQHIGYLPPHSVYELDVAGRVGLPTEIGAVVVNIAAVDPAEDGFATAYPCDGERPPTSNLNYAAGENISALAIVPVAADGSMCIYVSSRVDLAIDAIGAFTAEAFTPLEPAARLYDSRPGFDTVDGRQAGGGVVTDGRTITIDVGGRGTLPDDPGPTLITLAAIGHDAGYLTAWGCGRPRPLASNVNFVAGQTIANSAVIDVGPSGGLCVFARGDVDIVVDVVGTFDPTAVTVLEDAGRLLDTRPGFDTVDGSHAGTGLRQGRATYQLPVAGRAGIPPGSGAALVNVFSTEPRALGFVTVHPPTAETPTAANLNHAIDQTIGNLALVPLDANGDVCVFNRSRSHVVVDVIAYLPGPAAAPAAGECPAQDLFPHWRMIALYGNDSARVLGVLGEQDPDAAAGRLDRVIEPWAALSDRPILPTFELIATVAQASAGSSGLYRARSSDEFIQRYLDAARRHGVYLLLDLQPGRSDFLTEAKAYEKFLREPDVGLALDPEWRTEPPQRPGGGYVGKVDASEVNAVADWLATLVEEEDLPEKLLVVHQFQIRMITNKHLLREPEGIALTIHMDGFGTRSQKLDTYSYVHVDEPWSNGFKLFYDEDINMFGPADVLGGTVDPVPDLITYQ